ncbi:uncharacterized protein with PQ loop repeat [Saccharomonospora amisosensis]|uniref:DUF6545 domain-containing protein n=2 Tax=Saccharomonospora TaxID=1851 RepID=H5X658_9PSEU|nr:MULTISPECIES: MAB_1171c family putative transporter [Saccharomonospora]EHR53457.1 hypothetical protein SacmaDRAFT_5308 [Saccharomonospora marina XMU15]NIJ09770.1 uncharacterized protein with PQ loop repeat [Saccharomonospora amisosensis]
MVVASVVMWAASAIAVIWKTSQLLRAPHEKDLRVVTTCVALVFLALSAQLAFSLARSPEYFPSQFPKLIQNVILTFFFALLIVLLQSAVSPSMVSSRGPLEVALALLTSAGLIATFAATNPAIRGASYEGTHDNDPAVLTFYLIGNVYLAYATARGAYLAWSAASHTRSRAQLSLRVAAAGLVVCCVGTHLPRSISTSGRLTLGTDPLPGTGTWTTPLLATGIGVFFIGVGYPGIRTGIVKTRLWFEVRCRYRQLRPLWTAVCDRFPNIALFPPTHPIREAFHIRQMRLRYYRRVIECRDGLVCLSPYITEPADATKTPTRQAELVRDALDRSAQATQVSPVSVIAAPAADGMDADTQELLALSRALDRQRRMRQRHRSSRPPGSSAAST